MKLGYKYNLALALSNLHDKDLSSTFIRTE